MYDEKGKENRGDRCEPLGGRYKLSGGKARGDPLRLHEGQRRGVLYRSGF